MHKIASKNCADGDAIAKMARDILIDMLIHALLYHLVNLISVAFLSLSYVVPIRHGQLSEKSEKYIQ